MLKWCGHEAVAVLDGGLPAWVAAGGAVASGPANAVQAASFALRESLVALKLTADVSAALGQPTQTIVDARAVARFKGETEPFDPVAGHIPGALNRPFNSNFTPDGFMKSPAVLKAEFEALLNGRDPSTVVHHCGSGISAVPNVLAMELAGLGRPALYAGSWSDWCNTPGLPCAQG
jgi:thiosulfate/3-mercaptopyruvate sulfurtransferase